MNAKDVKMFMLTSGQEIIAELTDEVDPTGVNAFIVRNALVVQLVPQAQHSYGIGLIPFSPANTEGKHRIFRQAVASESVDVPVDLVNAYIQRTSSIEIAPATALIQLQ